MLTQQMPSLLKALDGILPDAALKQLTQALGNCQQPITARGDVSIVPSVINNYNGVYYGDQWNPNDYPDLFPTTNNIDNRTYIDVPGWNGPGQWTTNNYGGNTFTFPTTNDFNISQYYGGPTFNVGGETVLNNTYATNLTTNNINTTSITINGEPLNAQPPIPGPPGEPGRDGRDGVDGIDWNNWQGPGPQRPPKFKPIQIPIGASSVQLGARSPLVPRGTIVTNGKGEAKIKTRRVPQTTLTAYGTENVFPELRGYYLSGDVQIASNTTQSAGSCSIDGIPTITETLRTYQTDQFIDFKLTGELNVSDSGTTSVDTTAPSYTLSESGTISGTATVPTYSLSGDVSLEQSTDGSGNAETTPVTGTVPGYALTGTVAISQSGTISCNISIPKYKFDSTTQSLVSDGTESVAVSIPGWAVTTNTLALGSSGTQPVTGSVPKMKASSTLSVSSSGTTSASVSVPGYALSTSEQSWSISVPKYQVTTNTLKVEGDGWTPNVVTVRVPTFTWETSTKTGTCEIPQYYINNTLALQPDPYYPTIAVPKYIFPQTDLEYDGAEETVEVDIEKANLKFVGQPTPPVVRDVIVRPAQIVPEVVVVP